jgi:cytochrome c biogenesis protein CcmG/thiol:disulfide interchange protein DsbE
MEESQNLDPTPMHEPNKRKIWIPIVVILVVVVGALMAIKASVQKEAHLNAQPVELIEGAQIPDIEMNRLDGSKVNLSELPHKVMMINFWATWCEACIEEMPSIVALRAKYKAQGFEVLGVNVDENPAQVAPAMAKKMGMEFPLFTDKSNALAEMFDVHAIPLTVIINKDRKILYTESGGRDWNSEEIQQMMAQWVTK